MQSAGEVQIDGITLHRVIGRGASSVVYLGTQDRFDRDVAVKVLDLPEQTELAARLFVTECRTLGRLTPHPNIVTVFDCGTDASGRPYLLMEYLPDGTLAQELATDGPLPVDRVLRIGVQLAGALHTTHLHDIVHGDVKPQNVLRTRTGDAAISDFGVARLITAGVASTRVPLVTPLHAAPELFDGAAPTPRSDVYELCSTLFELLDGRPAVGTPEDSPLLIVGRLARGERRSLDPASVPAEVISVVESGLAADPRDRPADAAELGDALRDAERRLGLPVTPLVVIDQLPGVASAPPPADPAAASTLPPPGRRRGPLLALAVAAAAVLTVLGLWLARDEQPPVDVAGARADRSEDGPASTASTTAAVETSTTTTLPGVSGPVEVTYDAPGLNTSVALAERLGDPAGVFAPFGAGLDVFDTRWFPFRQLPATVRWQAYNQTDNPDCTGFLSRPVTVTGMWDKTANGPGLQTAVSVTEFQTAAQAAEAYVAFSLEQGAADGECFGFVDGTAEDHDALGVDHTEVGLDLPANDGSNNWLGPPPPSTTGFTSVRTGIVRVDDTLVRAYAASAGETVSPETFAALLGGVVDRLS